MIRILTLPGYARVYGLPLSEVTRRANAGELPSVPDPTGITRLVLDAPPPGFAADRAEPEPGQAIELITTPTLAAIIGYSPRAIADQVKKGARPAGKLGRTYLHFRPADSSAPTGT